MPQRRAAASRFDLWRADRVLGAVSPCASSATSASLRKSAAITRARTALPTPAPTWRQHQAPKERRIPWRFSRLTARIAWLYSSARDQVFPAQRVKRILRVREQGRHPACTCSQTRTIVGKTRCGGRRQRHERAGMGSAPTGWQASRTLVGSGQRKLASDLHLR